MNRRIRIGTDEFILWLRKNNRAVNVSNEGVQGLGISIHDLIVKENTGLKVEDNYLSYFASDEVGEYGLHKTSAQYEVESDRIGDIYEEIDTW